ncbi:RNA-splicing ligase RtcB [Sinorhizobium meliloti]|uniref:RtcB family protein n=1 Tax=Rhizobium meliloti TaxID=382 RepID=UPI000FD934B8|nr:RtcB family protein [Sinorhizobium meliloti]MDX0094272.1 RNA-splicing ligase RtcB [Sinorhizobium meliloti]MDX0139288.1 RNA-splicing ligase RtcB [Sinorhizobium meliloti]MDX0194034.1 RNA-splicing ligase RtcB [Sinorhizobium meliloti]MDX0382627.1 RNA-splicing ligase RtcB [Sinorhizobium meliloti]RVI36642.1 RNA-splicing ligase RtcB [Sinorhizobium meliloti]
MHKPIHVNLVAETDHEKDNLAKVLAHAEELIKIPTVEAIAIMPDACPAGHSPGTIPVGGVAKTGNALHPGMHSADVCCSVAMTNIGQVDPASAMDAAFDSTHFGMGGRPYADQVPVPEGILRGFKSNTFLAPFICEATAHFATQGDGNHFLSVGKLKSTGDTVIVTHHGSRKPGAMLYKRGLEEANRFMKDLGIHKQVPKYNAWLDYNSAAGREYWDALQIIRQWTRASHFSIHNMIAEKLGVGVFNDRFWNEHNFVFRRDGSFYHAKGATPSFRGFSADDHGKTLIPMNCVEPILITAHADAPNGLGFAPHGAGRNFSRSQHLATLSGRTAEEVISDEIGDIDFRAFNGKLDLSELPSAYKSAAKVCEQIDQFGLANVVDTIQPYGSIMAGEQYQPWKEKKKRGPKPDLHPPLS